MRTTLTIDDDVAAVLVRLRKARGAKLRDLINEALRRGLEDMSRRPKERRPFRTRSVDLGRLKVPSICALPRAALDEPTRAVSRALWRIAVALIRPTSAYPSSSRRA
jgi:hypothetical protein